MQSKKKIKFRFPNDDYYHETEINMDEFKKTIEFKDQIFGWYGDTFISILNDSNHDEIKTEKEPSNPK